MKLFLARAERRGQGLSSGRPISGQRLLKICHYQPTPTNSVALKLKSLFAERAKENQVVRKGEQPGTTLQNSAKLSKVDTRAELAKLAHVSHDTLAREARFDFPAPLCHHFHWRKRQATVGACSLRVRHWRRVNCGPLLFEGLCMDALSAHNSFCELPADELHALLPQDFGLNGTAASEADALLPLFVAGAAGLSGQLDDCRNVDDLKAACQHFASLWSSEIYGPEELQHAAAEVFAQLEVAVMGVGQALGAKLDRDAAFRKCELN